MQEKDVDLLLVDSGDLHDGTGLSDGFPPGGVDGHEVRRLARFAARQWLTRGADQQVHVRPSL